jgi:formylglycine-generating enzyme required for sulfatase activity
MKTQKILTSAAIAALITSASASVTMDWVTVGNAGNAADPLTGYGAVGYEYKIGKYEVTNAQYATFLNAKAKDTSTESLWYPHYNVITRSGASGSYTYSVHNTLANRPVYYVSWFAAARFANWMVNGMGSGSTETGAYTLNSLNSGIITKNVGAQIYIPTEDEWYKAAYYNSTTSSYSLHANGQNTITTADANYNNSVGTTTNVGSYTEVSSFYGTFDQGGNVWEWNDAVMSTYERGVRGGEYYYGGYDGVGYFLRSTFRMSQPHTSNSGYHVGFRLAAVPEPSSMLLTILTGGVMLIRRKR